MARLGTDLHTDAAEDLNALPASPLKDEALAVLEDMRESRKRMNASIERSERTPPPSRRDDWFSRTLPWLARSLAIAAIAVGADAIWTSEFCSRGRTSVSCSHGLRAQLEGSVTIAIGLLLATIPVQPSVWKRLATAFLGALTYGLVIASLLSK